MTNTLWATLGSAVQERMIRAYDDYVECDPSATDDDIRKELSTMDDDLLREHLMNGIGWEQVDEHDRNVDRPYANEARELEDTMLFMDMAHAVGFAMKAMRERIAQIEQENVEWDRIAKDYELNDGAKDIRRNRDLYMQRLKMSHDRLAELLLHHEIDGGADGVCEEGDGWLTRSIDTWIRG